MVGVILEAIYSFRSALGLQSASMMPKRRGLPTGLPLVVMIPLMPLCCAATCHLIFRAEGDFTAFSIHPLLSVRHGKDLERCGKVPICLKAISLWSPPWNSIEYAADCRYLGHQFLADFFPHQFLDLFSL